MYNNNNLEYIKILEHIKLYAIAMWTVVGTNISHFYFDRWSVHNEGK